MKFCKIIGFVLFCQIGLAAQARAAADLCDQAARRAAEVTGAPVELLRAIALTETRQNGTPWPWTINSNGKGAWFPAAQDAIAAAEDILSQGGQADVGCFQLNTRWHGAAFPSVAQMFDPDQNARYAAGFLNRLHDETGSWEKAVAAYHSRDPDRGAAYLDRVWAALATMRPTEELVTVRPPHGPQRPNRFPLLLAGDPATSGSVVPRLAGVAPLIGGP